MIPAYEYRWAAPLLDRYNHFLLKKSFARLRVAGVESLRSTPGSVIAAPNHSCWWDGCVDLYLSRAFLKRRTTSERGPMVSPRTTSSRVLPKGSSPTTQITNGACGVS